MLFCNKNSHDWKHPFLEFHLNVPSLQSFGLTHMQDEGPPPLRTSVDRARLQAHPRNSSQRSTPQSRLHCSFAARQKHPYSRTRFSPVLQACPHLALIGLAHLLRFATAQPCTYSWPWDSTSHAQMSRPHAQLTRATTRQRPILTHVCVISETNHISLGLSLVQPFNSTRHLIA